MIFLSPVCSLQWRGFTALEAMSGISNSEVLGNGRWSTKQCPSLEEMWNEQVKPIAMAKNWSKAGTASDKSVKNHAEVENTQNQVSTWTQQPLTSPSDGVSKRRPTNFAFNERGEKTKRGMLVWYGHDFSYLNTLTTKILAYNSVYNIKQAVPCTTQVKGKRQLHPLTIAQCCSWLVCTCFFCHL